MPKTVSMGSRLISPHLRRPLLVKAKSVHPAMLLPLAVKPSNIFIPNRRHLSSWGASHQYKQQVDGTLVISGMSG